MNSTPNVDPASTATEVVSDTGRFAIVPEWVEAADISDRAVRLYARLALWADRSSGETNPYHATLAKALKTSESSVKRALHELREIGAVSWVPRMVGDVQVANVYTVHRLSPAARRGSTGEPRGGQEAQGGVTDEPRGVQGATGGGSTGDLQDLEGTTPRGKDLETVVSDDVRRLSDLLADLMVDNGCRRPTITKSGFLDPIRLLIEKDGVEPERVERAIRWSQADEFWRANIHSGRALREKFDTLRQQAARSRKGSPTQVRDAASEFLARKTSA